MPQKKPIFVKCTIVLVKCTIVKEDQPPLSMMFFPLLIKSIPFLKLIYDLSMNYILIKQK